ncbi:hypothetical protein [Mesobacillus subterraneus]|uniref:DUF3888 domain-containing protein n=1 Tax=Mesobacillus subterraneus TaxID=285983 RepID=A0A427TWJ0_9BACI|nr:hypothetical protein [Mesobacillus subterraneus]RSD28686.1 hypothetical protein EJA10_03675 [Mesobacillus subterraneus]
MKKIIMMFVVGLLLVGWNGIPKNELLEETLYSRYHSYLEQTYSDFILCPKIDKIERIDGDIRRHTVNASGLDYDGHHGDIPYDRIHFTLTDTPEKGVVINQVRLEKGIPEKESLKQCGKRN